MKKRNKISLILFCVLLSMNLNACNKKNDDNNNNINIELPTQTRDSTKESTVINETKEISKKLEEKIATASNAEKNNINGNDELQKLIDNKSKLDKFIIQLQLLQENNLLDIYNVFNIGDSNKIIREGIDTAGYRYINNVSLKFLYDENLDLIDMDNRKGLIVFTKSKYLLDDEVSKLTKLDKFSDVDNSNIEIDIKGCDFDSFIVFTFNEDNVLVGKFKYLLSENGYKKDINILGGDLTYDVNFPLQITETADIKTIYEKLDTIREEEEQISEKIKELQKTLINGYEDFYSKTSLGLEEKTFLNLVKNSNLGIEKMNTVGLKKYNDRFLTNHTLGYYIFLSKDENQTSPDLRYNNIYMTFIFEEKEDKNMIYYRSILDETKEEEECNDIKKPEEYNLKEVYDEINKSQEILNNYEEQKKSFYSYLDKNLIYLNSKITYPNTYSQIKNEIIESGLDYIDNYDNKIIKEAKNAEGISISLINEQGNNIYNNCIKVTSNIRDIYYFFNNEELIGVYRSDYFDIAEITMKNYINLKTVKKGLNNLIEEENKIKQDIKLYQNVIDSKLKTFIDSIGFAEKNEKDKITKRKDIIVALDNSGFKYEEGMNKGDGLYFIGIYANKNDTKYAYKIYFNQSEQVELIQ